MTDKQKNRKNKVYSINYTVLVPFIFLFITTATISSILFFKSHTRNIENQIDLYQDMILQNTVLKLDNFMEKPHLMNAALSNALKNNPVLYRNLPEMRRIILNNLTVFPMVMAGGLGIEKNGNFIAAGRHINGGFDSAIHESEISTAYNYYKLDENGEPSELLFSRDTYNLKERSWYKITSLSKKPGWSSIYTFAARSGIGLTAVLPVYMDDQFSGVVQSAFTLTFISDFLNDLPMEGKHRIFIFDDSDYLIGTSGETEVVYKDDDDKLQRVGWDKIEDPIILSAFNTGAIDFSIKNEKTVLYTSEGENFFVKTRSYSGTHGLNWTIAVSDLRDDFTNELVVVFRQNLLISLFATVFFLMIGIFILRKLIYPLQLLSRAVASFSKDYQVIHLKKRGPAEIRELTGGFHSMSHQINQMMNNLKSTVKEKTEELEESEDQIKTLSGLVPICANCKKIRDDRGFWNNLESYIESHSDALFTHGICQDCARELYGDKKRENKKKDKS